MNPAPCSCLVSINFIFFDFESDSKKAKFSSPGIPNIYSTPSCSRASINRSEAFPIIFPFRFSCLSLYLNILFLRSESVVVETDDRSCIPKVLPIAQRYDCCDNSGSFRSAVE